MGKVDPEDIRCLNCVHWKRFEGESEENGIKLISAYGVCSYLSEAIQNGLDVNDLGGDAIATVWPSVGRLAEVPTEIATREGFGCSQWKENEHAKR